MSDIYAGTRVSEIWPDEDYAICSWCGEPPHQGKCLEQIRYEMEQENVRYWIENQSKPVNHFMSHFRHD